MNDICEMLVGPSHTSSFSWHGPRITGCSGAPGSLSAQDKNQSQCNKVCRV